MMDHQTNDVYALVAALEARIAEQEQTLQDVRKQLRRSSSRRISARSMTIVLVMLAVLASGAYSTATRAQQPADTAIDKAAAPSTTGDPVLVGKPNSASLLLNGEAETTTIFNLSSTQLAPKLLRVANYSTTDIGANYFPASTYQIAVIGSTSGVDTKTVTRVGVAGAAEWPATANRDPETATQAPQAGEAAAIGVYGYGKGSAGYGIWGVSENSIGGLFRGGSAPLYLTPSSTNGKPVTGTHYMGELYVSADGNLYFCTDYGMPGTWVQLNLAQTFVPRIAK